MHFKTVDDGYVKGIIITAESLLQLQDELQHLDMTDEERAGAETVFKFLKGCYDKAHNKPKKSWC